MLPVTVQPSRSLPHGAPRSSRPSAPAFTLIELLVAITIIVLASIVIIPSFARLLESTNYANAVNTVSSAMGQARALAIRNGRYAGVAFLFDTVSERYTLQVLEIQSEGGTGYLTTRSGINEINVGTYCQPFRPAEGLAPIELPRGMGVYGLSYAITRRVGVDDTVRRIDSRTLHWYCGEILDEGQSNPAGGRIETVPWIFPRNDPRFFTVDGSNPWDLPRSQWGTSTADEVTAIRHASSFYVCFDPTGAMVTSTSDSSRSLVNAYIEYPERPVETNSIANPRLPVDLPNNFDPENTGAAPAIEIVEPNPEVVLRAVSALAVVELSRLARETGIERPWLVRPTSLPEIQFAPKRLDVSQPLYFSDDFVRRISLWIDRNAEILTFNRFTGNVNRKAQP